MVTLVRSAHANAPNSPKPWVLPGAGLSVFHGRPETPRLSHYFLPHALLHGRRALYLDGANRFDPLLMARLARERDAQVAFRRALAALGALRARPLGVAVFSDAASFQTARRGMFRQLLSQASDVWRFELDGEGRPRLVGEKAARPLPA